MLTQADHESATTSQRSLQLSAAMKAQAASSTARTSKLSRLLWRFVATLIGLRARASAASNQPRLRSCDNQVVEQGNTEDWRGPGEQQAPP